MDAVYFESIEKHFQETNVKSSVDINPTRKIIRNLSGQEIKKVHSQIPEDTLKKMLNNTVDKYTRVTNEIKHKIKTGKRKGLIKYQTLGWKQAKEIKLWCCKNNINCDIVEDLNVTRNKLQSINVWHKANGELYDDGTRDYSRQFLDFCNKKQNVVYVQITK